MPVISRIGQHGILLGKENPIGLLGWVILVSSSNEHGCILLTCGCGVVAQEWKVLYWTVEKVPNISKQGKSRQWIFSNGMSLLLPINGYIFVCLILAIFMFLIFSMSPIFVNLGYLVSESCLYVLVMCFSLLAVF